MALESVVFPNDFFSNTMRELCSLGGGIWGHDFGGLEKLEEKIDGGVTGEEFSPLVQELEVNHSPETEPASVGRKKRRRAKKCKNIEEVENQRMTHIAVERNRRKQMNEYLGLLRSLMPASYVQRGDQASIVGGAINFVKELEQHLQSLEAEKLKQQAPQYEAEESSNSTPNTMPFANFFAFPQYSSCSSSNSGTTGITDTNADEMFTENKPSAVANIEVTMVESHANLKVLMKRRPKLLLKMVAGLQNLQLTTLHLNVTSVDQLVLYSFSLKMEEDCPFTCVDEIAAAVHQLVVKIQDDAGVNEPM